MAGPIGIAQQTGRLLDATLAAQLFFVGFLSINLAVLNILPFPPLDGGRVLIVLIEAVRRRRLSAEREALIYFTGFVVLIALVILISIQDIARLPGADPTTRGRPPWPRSLSIWSGNRDFRRHPVGHTLPEPCPRRGPTPHSERSVRRSRVALILTILGLLMAVSAAPVAAASLTVNSPADTAANDGSCTLREAITAANTDTASGASPASAPLARALTQSASAVGHDHADFGLARHHERHVDLRCRCRHGQRCLDVRVFVVNAGVVDLSASRSREVRLAAEEESPTMQA